MKRCNLNMIRTGSVSEENCAIPPYLSSLEALATLATSPFILTQTSLEQQMDYVFQSLVAKPKGKKRGRKPLRASDPIRRKTEEKDKFWLRAFRSYTSSHSSEQVNSIDKDFWCFYLSKSCSPGKGRLFLSYGRKYKDFLFSHKDFAEGFKRWFEELAPNELLKKCEYGSDLWVVYYNYADEELKDYVPKLRE